MGDELRAVGGDHSDYRLLDREPRVDIADDPSGTAGAGSGVSGSVEVMVGSDVGVFEESPALVSGEAGDV